MTQHTINLSDDESKAFAYVAVSPQEWLENMARERCRLASEEITRLVVDKCLQAQQPIPNSVGAMIDLAYSEGWIETAAQRKADADAARAAEKAAGQSEQA
jgi:hypothetical protein